jgi:putative DNA primase/helicase
MASPKANPYLSTVLDATASALEFALAAVMNKADPAECYNPIFLRALAAHAADHPEAVEGVKIKLSHNYGKDFNSVRWRSLLKQHSAALTTAVPSDLLRSENNSVKPILANALILMRQSVKLAYDEFANAITFLEPAPWGNKAPVWQDIDDSQASDWLQHRNVTVKAPVVNEAAAILARETTIHPVRDWLASLKWDGTPRIESWIVDLLGVPDTQYARLVSERWLIQAVARVMRPGIKAESVLILEGPQGTYKSTALRALANGHLESDRGVQWFSDSLPSIGHDEIATHLQGIWIFEIAELEAIRGRAWTDTKKFFSIQQDRFRAKYGRNIQKVNRQQVFAASTNEPKWAGDPTGARRFWPVKPGNILIDKLLAERDQLWAEAAFKYNEGVIFHFPQDQRDIANAEQMQRYEEDVWQLPVAKWLREYERSMEYMGHCAASEILSGACGMPRSQQDRADGFRLATIMRRLGWESVAGPDGEVWRRREE